MAVMKEHDDAIIVPVSELKSVNECTIQPYNSPQKKTCRKSEEFL